ncbi:MAG: hypothetical protein IPH44_01485 [Myxococcales bacterium]|nr:hypothetical protein [Myxococcales bacterium]MBK7197988.1 hypothetical protein [Myxococcales bacterium]MBP6848102.1 hypothetical protein [Kofleriaceae bacterium]
MRLALAALALALAACGAGEIPVPDHAPAPPDPAAPAPQVIVDARPWYLAGDALTPADPRFVARADGPATVVDVWLDGAHVARAHADGTFDLGFDLADVAIGDHTVLVSADGADVAFAELPLHKSAALYVAVSNDWDTGDHTDDKLQRQERLHAAHPHLVLTHFVGPYTFTDPTVSAARAQQLVDWVLRFRAEKGDEIGLHIHPYCNFVTAAGVTCRTSPSFRDVTDATGYTVVLGAYTRAELDQMFAKATELFMAHGLGRPTSFRAGGWTATGDVLGALEGAGHVTDASGCNWARLEEWRNVANASLYQWNQQHWGPINETTQPYYPSVDDILVDAAPHRGILEAADNGALVDYVTADEMIAMFRANFDGAPLPAPRHYSIGYHPINFGDAYLQRIDNALIEIDRHLAVDGAGPVVYARMSDLPVAFPRPR